MDKRLDRLLEWIETEAERAPRLLLPVSGGSDSALVFWLLNQHFHAKTVGIFAGAPSSLRERAWFDWVGNVEVVSQPTDCEAETARWALFSVRARSQNAWLVGSRNRTEDVLGTFSIASRAATFLPIAGIWKSDVMELCKKVGVPTSIRESSRRADPACGRPAALAQIPWHVTDTFLRYRVGELEHHRIAALDREQVNYLERVYVDNQFRRHLPRRGPQL